MSLKTIKSVAVEEIKKAAISETVKFAANQVGKRLSANSARFLISIAGGDPAEFSVTKFSGVDEIGAPYGFDIEFQSAESKISSALSSISPGSPKSKEPLLTAEEALGRPCRFELLHGKDPRASYNGVVVEFGVMRRAKPIYAIRLVSPLWLLSRGINSRVFQKRSVLEIVEEVIGGSGIGRYCDVKFECGDAYPPLDFCVQYGESDLNFISRLMEREGIWYFNLPNGSGKDSVIITDKFSLFPAEPIEVSLSESSGFNDSDDTVSAFSSRVGLVPERIALRSYNYLAPSAPPEAVTEFESGSGGWGSVYRYGGAFKNDDEAKRAAAVFRKRVLTERARFEGEGRSVSFRAGARAEIEIGRDEKKTYLITSVRHEGGAGKKGGGYTYKNAFSCIDCAPGIYAPPLRAELPRAHGLITAAVDAQKAVHPSLDELGRYKVKFPFDREGYEDGYGASKPVRLAQISGGMSDGRGMPYGVHFPSKLGAEMVIACVDGDPDAPLGLGFVPNADAPSVVGLGNKFQNIMRTWGGNELVMDDSPERENINLATPKERSLELHDGDERITIKSVNSQITFNDTDGYALLHADEIRLESTGDIRIKAAGGVYINGARINILSGDEGIDIESTSSLTASAAEIAIESSGSIVTTSKETTEMASAGEVVIKAKKTASIEGKEVIVN